MESNICLILSLTLVFGQGSKSEKIGDLSSKSHGVSGAVNILDSKRIMIVGFSYDGTNTNRIFEFDKCVLKYFLTRLGSNFLVF